MKKITKDNASFTIGILCLLMLIVDLIFIFTVGRHSKSIFSYFIFVTLYLFYLISGILSFVGLFLAFGDYKKNSNIKRLIKNSIPNLVYLVAYILTLFALMDVGVGV